MFRRCYLLAACLTARLVRSEISDSVPVSPRSTTGFIVDAGSQGSRLHVYNWAPREFSSVPPPITVPTSNEQWTARMSPGISTLGDFESVGAHLAQLIDYAKSVLVGYEEQWDNFPLYFKATGGMREMPMEARERMMRWVRQHLSDKAFNPFLFRPDMARVISGEEEAAYSWAAMNFLMGVLLPATQGTGTVDVASLNTTTFGTLDLGGASSQIAFFLPSQDISEGLFKLHIGAQKHWNIYTKSYLTFGQQSARERHLQLLADLSPDKSGPANGTTVSKESVLNFCFHAGYAEEVATYSASSRWRRVVRVVGPTLPARDQFDRCSSLLRPLMEEDHSDFCDTVYDGQCSIYGSYQPAIPTDQRFIGTSSYKYAWNILMLPDTARLKDYKEKARFVCSLSYADAGVYSASNSMMLSDDKLLLNVPYFCFISTYTYVLLVNGYGFSDDSVITVLDQVNGNKAGWALGAIMYEINTLPWELTLTKGLDWNLALIFMFIGLILGALLAIVSYYFFLGQSIFSEVAGKGFLSRSTSKDTEVHLDGLGPYQYRYRSVDSSDSIKSREGVIMI